MNVKEKSMSNNKIGLAEVKQAIKDSRFREMLGPELHGEIDKFLNNPGCPCNVPLYRKILKDYRNELSTYFPSKEIEEAINLDKIAENHWSVINCHKDELETTLRKLPPGRKQLAIARHEDQVTVIINELDISF